MTFSLILRDEKTGSFGSVISSSSPAVAARCVNLKDGVGGAHSQNVTDPRLGGKLIAELTAGLAAEDAVKKVVAEADQNTIDYRQLLALDANGNGAVHSGGKALGTFGANKRKNAVAGGNMLASLDVLDALVETGLNAKGTVEERLFAAFEAALAAGGEEGPVHSIGLAVVTNVGWRVTDLRVDWSADPLEDMRRLLGEWLPQRDDYVSRALNPAVAPSYGVPGDE